MPDSTCGANQVQGRCGHAIVRSRRRARVRAGADGAGEAAERPFGKVAKTVNANGLSGRH